MWLNLRKFFTFKLESPKKKEPNNSLEYLCYKGSDLVTISGNSSQSEKTYEIKLPLSKSFLRNLSTKSMIHC